MLTVYTSTCCRPDYVELLACALSRTVTEPYRFVAVVHPRGLRREWSMVDEVIDGTTEGYRAWHEILPLITGPSVILHDDCIPVLPWSSASFPGPHVIRFAGETIQYHAGPAATPVRVLRATRIGTSAACPSRWPAELCEAAVAAKSESMMDGVFLHIDKGTLAHPDCPASAAKPALVAEIAAHLGCEVPSQLTPDELAVHPGRHMGQTRPGLGDIVSAGLAAVGITPERVSKVLGRPCGCKERAAKLNELGRRIGIG